MAESRKPTFAWDSKNKAWSFWIGDKTQAIVTIDGNGLAVNKGSLTYTSVTIGTLATAEAFTAVTGSIENLNVPTLATLQALNTAGQGSIANLNTTTGTITTLNAVNIAKVARAQIGGGGTISYMAKFTGTIALAAVGTMTVGVATVSNLGSSGIAVGDQVVITPKAAISGVLLGLGWIPTTNVVIVPVSNAAIDSAGSLPAVGVDILVTRTTVTA